jgi:hypothetical protein
MQILTHIRDDPEDQPQTDPGRSNHHCNILTSNTQRNHSEKVEHPVDKKGSMAVRNRITVIHVRGLCLAGDGVRMCEVDLKGHRNK